MDINEPIANSKRIANKVTISRRSLLQRGAALGMTIGGLGTLLAACGSSSSSSSTSSTGSSGSSNGGSAAGSTPSNSSAVSQSTGSAAKPKSGGSLTFGLYLEPDSLDPAVTPYAVSHTIMMNIYDTIVWRSDAGDFVPGLAEKWEASTDGLTYTLSLRKGVKFHDGTDFDANAIKFALDHIVDPSTHSGYASTLLGPYDHTDVVDPQTAKVVFKAPFAPFIDGASQAFLGIPSPTAVKKDPKAFLPSPGRYRLHEV